MLENHSDSKILIVDSMDYNSMLIGELLKAEGYSDISSANTGEQAIEMIKTTPFDLVLLDVALPDMSGLEVCSFIKNKHSDFGAAVIIQSANTKEEAKKEAFERGANDFINKPIEKTELTTRVKLHLDQKRLYAEIITAHKRMAEELEEASKMLFMMLPAKDMLKKVNEELKVDIASYYKPSSELGGDFYDVAIVDQNKMAFYIWDFAGHGVGAAINTFRLNSIIRENLKIDATPNDFMTRINKQLHKLIPIGQFATMFFGLFDMESGTLTYSCASCPKPLLISFKHNKCQLIDTRNFPLGIQDTLGYEQEQISIEEWDIILLYSDALTESPNEEGAFLEIEEVGEMVLARAVGNYMNPNEIKALVMDRFNAEFIGGLSDDLTINIISLNKVVAGQVQQAV